MAKTSIEWSDYTFNPIWGCQRVSPGCVNCYAEAWDKRVGGKHWGPGSARRQFGEKHWAQPLAWNAKAKRDGRIYRVFCASMGDWLEDHEDWIEPRLRLEALVAATPNLIWLFLTKRPENWPLMPKAWVEKWPSNAMFGFTGENAEQFVLRVGRRDYARLKIGGQLRTFLSAEPLLGNLDAFYAWNATFDWVICGGESGHGARPMHPDWARGLRDQCNAAGVPFLFKQWGEWTPGENVQRQSGIVETATWFNDKWAIFREDLARTDGHVDDQPDLYRVGKKAAGRLLDGREWNELPKYWPENVGLLAKDELISLAQK